MTDTTPAADIGITALTVTITQPTNGGTLPALSTPVTWTTTGTQARYRISLRTTAGAVLETTPILLGADKTWTMPLAWAPATASSHRLRVEAWEGWGDPVTAEATFSWSYTQPAAITNLTVTDAQLGHDLEASTPRLDWDHPTISLNEFAGVVIRRRPEAGTAADDVVVAHITDFGETTWHDVAAPANEPLRYTVTYLRKVGTTITASAPATVTHTAPLTIPVVASVNDGLALRFPLAVMGVGLSGTTTRREEAVWAWGGEGRATVLAPPAGHGQRSADATFHLYDLDGVPAWERKAWIERTILSGDPLVVRFEHERWHARVADWEWARRETIGSLAVSVSLEEIAFEEGVEVTV